MPILSARRRTALLAAAAVTGGLTVAVAPTAQAAALPGDWLSVPTAYGPAAAPNNVFYEYVEAGPDQWNVIHKPGDGAVYVAAITRNGTNKPTTAIAQVPGAPASFDAHVSQSFDVDPVTGDAVVCWKGTSHPVDTSADTSQTPGWQPVTLHFATRDGADGPWSAAREMVLPTNLTSAQRVSDKSWGGCQVAGGRALLAVPTRTLRAEYLADVDFDFATTGSVMTAVAPVDGGTDALATAAFTAPTTANQTTHLAFMSGVNVGRIDGEAASLGTTDTGFVVAVDYDYIHDATPNPNRYEYTHTRRILTLDLDGDVVNTTVGPHEAVEALPGLTGSTTNTPAVSSLTALGGGRYSILDSFGNLHIGDAASPDPLTAFPGGPNPDDVTINPMQRNARGSALYLASPNDGSADTLLRVTDSGTQVVDLGSLIGGSVEVEPYTASTAADGTVWFEDYTSNRVVALRTDESFDTYPDTGAYWQLLPWDDTSAAAVDVYESTGPAPYHLDNEAPVFSGPVAATGFADENLLWASAADEFTFNAPATDLQAVTYSWAVDASPVVGATGDSVTVTFPAEGTYTVAVTATDASGSSRSVSRDFVVAADSPDTTDPTFDGPITAAQADGNGDLPWTSDTDEFEFSSPASDNVGVDHYTWTLNGAPVAGATGPTMTTTLPAVGSYTVGVTVADAAGNTATQSEVFTAVEVNDPEPPANAAPSVKVVKKKATVKAHRTIKVVATDDEAVATVTAKMVQKRGDRWFFLKGTKWVKAKAASPAKSKAKALRKAKVRTLSVVGDQTRAVWKVTVPRLTKGVLIVKVTAVDADGATGQGAYKVKLKR